MITITTYRQHYKLNSPVDFECNLGIYGISDGGHIYRFHSADRNNGWTRNIIDDTYYSFEISPTNRGVVHCDPSLDNKIIETFLDIIDMTEDELTRLRVISDGYNHNDATHIVMNETYNKLNRDNKIDSIIK